MRNDFGPIANNKQSVSSCFVGKSSNFPERTVVFWATMKNFGIGMVLAGISNTSNMTPNYEAKQVVCIKLTKRLTMLGPLALLAEWKSLLWLVLIG